MKRTLKHLGREQRGLRKLIEQDFCLIQDGWAKMPPSMRKYLKEVFCEEDGGQGFDWGQQMELELKSCPTKLENCNYLFEYVRYNDADGLWYCAPAPHGVMKGLRVTMMIKGNNRRKHNSHKWFFDTFCLETQPTFSFTTDAGTGFDRDCMRYLYGYVLDHPNCVAATGRQRVMSASMQDDECDDLIGAYFRKCQDADYES